MSSDIAKAAEQAPDAMLKPERWADVLPARIGPAKFLDGWSSYEP